MRFPTIPLRSIVLTFPFDVVMLLLRGVVAVAVAVLLKSTLDDLLVGQSGVVAAIRQKKEKTNVIRPTT